MAKQINKVVILDNGAYTIKVGYSTDETPLIIPNCITKVKSERRRPFIGDQLEECKDYSGMFYILPFKKGYIINWDVQRQVWDYVFRIKLKLPSDSKNRFSQIGLIISEPLYNFKQIRENMIEFLFEEYGFGSIFIASAPQLAAFKYFHEQNYELKKKSYCNFANKSKEMACLVVDSGYSFSHVVPFIEGNKLLSHSKRINVGGKLLTNHLKEVISYRQLNVLDETYVVNQMKEDCCFVSTDYWPDLDIASRKNASNTIKRDYVLPDYISFKRGFIFDKTKHAEIVNANDHQRIRMNNERFQIPELLFNPGDALISQIGLSHCITDVVSQFNPDFTIETAANSADVAMNSVRERPDNLRDIDSDEDEESEEEEEDEEEDEKEMRKNDDKEKGSKKKTDGDGDDKSKEKANGQNGTDESSSTVNGIERSKYQDLNIQAHLYNNILLIGGNCNFSNFQERISNDIRMNVRDMLHVRVKKPAEPSTYAWHGGRLLCGVSESGDSVRTIAESLFTKYAITREEYHRKGLVNCAEKFAKCQLATFS